MFSEIDGVSRVTVETSFGSTCDSAGKQEHVVEGEAFLAELPLERDEALDLLLAELGLHHVTLAAPADDDQPEPSTPKLVQALERERAAETTSPFARGGERALDRGAASSMRPPHETASARTSRT